MPPLSEELVTLVQVLLEHQPLREWLQRLESRPAPARGELLTRMAAQMRQEGADLSTARALAELRHPEVFRGVCEALRALQP